MFVIAPALDRGASDGAHQEKYIVGKVWAQGLQAGHAADGVLRGPVQDEACAALLAVLKYENDSLRRHSSLSWQSALVPAPWHGVELLQGLAESCLGKAQGTKRRRGACTARLFGTIVDTIVGEASDPSHHARALHSQMTRYQHQGCKQQVYRAYLRKVHLLSGKHERVRNQQAAFLGHFNWMRPESGPAVSCFRLFTSLLPAVKAKKASEDTSRTHRCRQHAMRCVQRVIKRLKRPIWSIHRMVCTIARFRGVSNGLTSAASGTALAAAGEAFWLAIRRALNSRQSVSAWAAGRLSGMPSLCLSGCLEPSLLSELCLSKFQHHSGHAHFGQAAL